MHQKPILLDVGGYWQPLLALLRHVVEQGFAGEDVLGFVTLAEDVGELERVLRAAL